MLPVEAQRNPGETRPLGTVRTRLGDRAHLVDSLIQYPTGQEIADRLRTLSPEAGQTSTVLQTIWARNQTVGVHLNSMMKPGEKGDWQPLSSAEKMAYLLLWASSEPELAKPRQDEFGLAVAELADQAESRYRLHLWLTKNRLCGPIISRIFPALIGQLTATGNELAALRIGKGIIKEVLS